MSATALKERLRADLKAAMQARSTAEVGVLRTLIAALDNAEAIPGVQYSALPRAFGDASEVARLDLDEATVQTLLAGEVQARLAAAADYDRHGRNDEADRLRREAELVSRYTGP